MYWERYCELCARKGMMPVEVGTRIGVGRTTVLTWEQGQNPSLRTVQRAADFFDVSIDYLVGRVDNPYSNKNAKSRGGRTVCLALS